MKIDNIGPINLLLMNVIKESLDVGACNVVVLFVVGTTVSINKRTMKFQQVINEFNNNITEWLNVSI